MRKENVFPYSIAEQAEADTPPRPSVTGKAFAGFLSRLLRPNDFTLEDWRRLEFRNTLPSSHYHHVINQFQGRL